MKGARKVAIIGSALVAAYGCGGRMQQMLPPAEKEMSIQAALLYDANHDGKVTREEMEAGLRREFAAADRNSDGFLDLAEMQAENQKRFNANQTGFSPLIDWNRDGKLDMMEFATTTRSMFAELDTDQNGVLEGAELRVPRPPRQAGGAVGRFGRPR